MDAKKLANILLIAVIAQLLCVTTVFLAPLPLMLLKRKEGRAALFIAGGIAAVTLYFLAPAASVIMLLLSLLVAEVLSDCESLNLGYSTAVFVTVVILAGVTVLAISFAIHNMMFEPVSFFRQQIEATLNQVGMPQELKIDKEALLKQIPSALTMVLIFAVWLNSILVTRVEKILKWKPSKLKHRFGRYEYKQWKVPDYFVWLALLSAAGSFLLKDPQWLKWTSTNVFNVVVMLYFFQGLAVVVSFFDAKKISPIWRAIVYLLIFTQLFLAAAFIGFVDLWMNFRNKTKTDKSAVA